MSELGVVLTLVFGVLAVVFYVRQRRHKRLTFIFDEIELQTKNHPDVTFAFKGEPVENLSRLRVILWNSGTEAIRQSDLPSDTPPTIHLPEKSRVLSIGEVLAENGSPASVKPDQNNLSVFFEYLNPDDYVFTEVLYENRKRERLGESGFVAKVIGGVSTARRFMRPSGKGFILAYLGLILSFAFLSFHTIRIDFNRLVTARSAGEALWWYGFVVALGILAISGMLLYLSFRTLERLQERRDAPPQSAAEMFS